MKRSPLREKVYNLLLTIPSGRVTTYGEIARALNSKGYRAIGAILNKNPQAPQVPCHRVVMSDGSIGGYAFGVQKKEQLLAREGVTVLNDQIVDFQDKFFKFK